MQLALNQYLTLTRPLVFSVDNKIRPSELESLYMIWIVEESSSLEIPKLQEGKGSCVDQGSPRSF